VIIIVGPPGNGADSLAQALEARGKTVITTDVLIEEQEGISLSELAIAHGPERYAQAESRASLTALASDADVVILGSGALGNAVGDDRGAAVREALDKAVAGGATKVFLTASPKALMNRAGLNVPRSVAIGSPRSMYLTQLRSRTPLYETGAVMIDTTEENWDELADQILA